MTIDNTETIVMAFAKYAGSYYTLAAHPFRAEENGLLCLGRATEGEFADLHNKGISEAELEEWHTETLRLLNAEAPKPGDHVFRDGDNEPAGEDGTVQPLPSPWYAAFAYNPAGKADGGGLWVGRFFGGESAPTLEDADAGVYVISVRDAAEDAGGEPRVRTTKVDRSVVISSRPKSAGTVQKSAEHGPGKAAGGRRIQW